MKKRKKFETVASATFETRKVKPGTAALLHALDKMALDFGLVATNAPPAFRKTDHRRTQPHS